MAQMAFLRVFSKFFWGHLDKTLSKRRSKIFCRRKVAFGVRNDEMRKKTSANSISVFALFITTAAIRAAPPRAAFPEYLPKVTAPLSQPAVHYVLHHDFFGRFFRRRKKRATTSRPARHTPDTSPRSLQFPNSLRMIQQK